MQIKNYSWIDNGSYDPQPILKTLDKEDQEFFEGMAEYGGFIDHIEHFLDSFEIRLVDGTIAEVE